MKANGCAETLRLNSIIPRTGEKKRRNYIVFILLFVSLFVSVCVFYVCNVMRVASLRSSLFFNALYSTLNGGIDFSRRNTSSAAAVRPSADPQPQRSEAACTVVIDDLFVELRNRMAKGIEKLNQERVNAVEGEATTALGKESAAATAEKTKKKKAKKEKKAAVVAPPEMKSFVPIPAQDPVLFLPSDLSICSTAVSNPVCFRASLPPSPGKPFAVKVGDTFVMLEWEQLEFDGAPTTRYDIYMKNESRLYSDWKLVPNACNIPNAGLYTRFTVNHLPIGVRTEFKIFGYNCSGRSPPSKASVKVCPGENLVPLGSEHRWRRVAAGGPMAVLDIMEHNSKIRNDILGGFRLMIAFAQKTGGFQRTAVQLRGATLTFAAINTYPDDIRVVGGALIVLG